MIFIASYPGPNPRGVYVNEEGASQPMSGSATHDDIFVISRVGRPDLPSSGKAFIAVRTLPPSQPIWISLKSLAPVVGILGLARRFNFCMRKGGGYPNMRKEWRCSR